MSWQWLHNTETLYSCTIITTAATDLMNPIHDRMPVVIRTDQYHNWLDKDADIDQVSVLLNYQAYEQMTATRVSAWVNNPQHDELCIKTG